jgi:hypothetical protein
MRTHPDRPGQRIVDLVLYGRWTRTAKVPMLFDCDTGQRADIVDGIEFDESGGVVGATWINVKADDPVLKVACEEV